MAFDGLVLNQLSKGLQEIVPSKINKIQQVSDTEILFTLRTNNKTHKLMISCHSNYNRIHLTNRTYTTPDNPLAFIMLLRKYINGAIIKDMKQLGYDRILQFTIEARNELGDIHTILMYVELMGKYANIILVNDDNKIIDALKRIPPFENSVRTIHPGAEFIPVNKHEGKQDPYHTKDLDLSESFSKQVHGFSPILSSEFHFRINKGEDFNTIMNEIASSNSIYVGDKDGKQYFHVIPLTHLETTFTEFNIQEGMDNIYYEKEEKVRIKEQSGDLFKLVKAELKKSNTKLDKLNKTLDAAYDLENYRIYGDLLYAYAYQYPKKLKEVTLTSFENNQDICIPLDEKLDIKQNAKKYYQKYKKSKTAQVEVAKQIALTKETINYFEILQAQLEQASFLDAIEIREELSSNGYLRKKQMISRKKKSKPNFLTLEIDGIQIYVGKNNIQNDYITWKQSRKDYLWMHTKDIHGAHIVINQAEVKEEIMRIAAMFAAYYSKARQSSSVPVNYCLIKQLKKPVKANLGQVVLSNYKTIYIDPEEDQIQECINLYQIKI